MGSTGVWCATACAALAVSLMARSPVLAQSPAPHIPTPAHKQTPIVVAFGSCGPDGKPGDPADLPEDYREGEKPSGRRPVRQSICEGPFAF